MVGNLGSVRSVTATLNGRLPAETEWTEILATANRAWLGPALYVSLAGDGRLDRIPNAVKDYLILLHDRNRERNMRLRSQLVEALRAMNRHGIEPVLLKGAISIFCAEPESVGARMTSDLDLSIDPADEAKARAALRALGYAGTARSNEMGRSEDVGTIELHTLPNRRSSRYLGGDLRSASTRVGRDGAVAWIPSATSRALHLIVHDMIKEGDLWRLRFDLRHLGELAELAASADGIEWKAVAATLNDDLGLRALEMQATALHDLFDASVPDEFRTRRARIWHAARLRAASKGPRAATVRAIGRFAWGMHRLGSGYRWTGPRDFARRAHRVMTEPQRGSRL